MGQKIFIDSIYQSMRDSAQQVRLSLGRPSSHATRQQALQQVAMLQAEKDIADGKGITFTNREDMNAWLNSL